jgi:hypothetical protein
MRKVIFLFILSVSVTRSFGQSDISFALGGGIMYYNGDLSAGSYFPPTELYNAFVGADVSMLLIDRLDLSLRYMRGRVSGDDALVGETDNIRRNLSFYSKIDEVNILLRLRLFSVVDKRLVNPYAMFGLGYFWFNPMADLDGKSYELQPLGTEGQFIEGGGYPEPYSLHSASLTGGIGLFFRISNAFQVRLEASPQLTFTDYLDDLSGFYPDSTELAATPNGPIAVQLSSRKLNGQFPVKGKGRGNPERDDVIITVGLSVVYTPVKSTRQKSRPPGVFHQIFKGKKGWWGQSPH